MSGIEEPTAQERLSIQSMRAIATFDMKSRPARASFIMVVLTVFSALSMLIAWIESVDARAWWPVALLFWFFVTYVYALAYALLVNHHRLTRPSFLILYHAALGSTLLLKTYLNYAVAIDWIAVNAGFAHLSVVQRIAASHKTFYAIHLIFLIAAVIWSCAASRSAGSTHSGQ